MRKIDPQPVAAFLELLIEARRGDRQVFFCGTGDGAALSSLMAAGLSRPHGYSGGTPLRARALTDSGATLTASTAGGISSVFAGQLAVHGSRGDLCVVLAGRQDAALLAAAAEARRLGITVVTLGGGEAGEIEGRSDLFIQVPTIKTSMVVTAQMAVYEGVAALLAEVDTKIAEPEPEAAGESAAIFIERDGVINRHRTNDVLAWDDFEFIPGSLEAVALLASHGHRLVVVSNQAAVGRGLLSLQQLTDIHRRMEQEIASRGGRVDAVDFCPHAPGEGCACRLPLPGMLRRSAQDLGVDVEGAYFIGDHPMDIEAARAAGAGSILVLSGRQQRGPVYPAPDIVFDDLLAAAKWLVEAPSAARTREMA
jgi:D-glycero-D-manno-heptose 1,7-bisphosphate phosphatase